MKRYSSLDCDEFVDLAAATALDDADPRELERVEQHAAKCADCAAMLDEFRETASLLGAAVPQIEPPHELRSRVLKAVAGEPRPILRRLIPRGLFARPRLSPAWVVASASFVVALISLVWVAMLQGQISDLQHAELVASDRAARFDRVAQVLASDRLAIRELQPMAVSQPMTGYVFLDPASGTGMLMCHDLPPTAQGRAYEIWFMRGSERMSAGMLWPDRSGNGYTMIKVPSDLQSYDAIAVTDEPGTGSEWPTTPRIMGTRLRESAQSSQ